MKISNVKLGHSTNSSSSHSIVFFQSKHDGRDHDVDDVYFGWDFFTVKSEASKEKYFIALLFANLMDVVGLETAKILVRELTGFDHKGESVDHQSITAFPLTFDGKFLDLEFIRDFREYLKKDNVAILGGNDNTDEVHNLESSTTPHGINKVATDTNIHMRCRKDNNYWILFNDYTGAKIRFSFTAKNDYLRSSTPELIDIKITDKCSYGCGYCYQGSTPNGRQGNRQFLGELSLIMRDMKVFEVALGGGEPTEYEHLNSLLDEFKEKKINVNLTTRNADWLKLNVNLVANGIISGVGFSVDTDQNIDPLVELMKGNPDISPRRFTVQYVMGNDNCRENMLKISDACVHNGFTLLLLGMKKKGRAANKKPVNYSSWLEWFEGKEMPNLSIDTKMVQDSSMEDLEKINDLYITKNDGMFSCYIDAVDLSIAPSSYCDESEVVKLDIASPELHETIRKAYVSF